MISDDITTLQEGDDVCVVIQSKFETMFSREHHRLNGHVYQIIDGDERLTSTNHNDVSERLPRLIVVKTAIGRFTFTDDGQSINTIYALEMSSHDE